MHFARFGRPSKGFGLRVNVIKTSFEVLKGNQNCEFAESEENRKAKTSPKKEKKKKKFNTKDLLGVTGINTGLDLAVLALEQIL